MVRRLSMAHAPPTQVDISVPVPVLETVGLSCRFGGFQALTGVNLRVMPGHIHAVIGPNGAGKSTLFNVITGALTPSAGRVFVKGADVTSLPPHQVARRGLARNFQITQVFGTLTVEQNLSLAADRRALRPLANRPTDRLDAILEQAHLASRRRGLAGVLGHGERKRLELAMTLATGAGVLLLDEPTSGMSVEERAEMATMLTGVAREATVLITEHDFDFIKSVSDVVTVLADGQIMAEGSPQEIEKNVDVRARYLGVADA